MLKIIYNLVVSKLLNNKHKLVKNVERVFAWEEIKAIAALQVES